MRKIIPVRARLKNIIVLIYVDSPFQLLQVFELRTQIPVSSSIFVRLNGKAENDKQLLFTLDLLNINARRVVISSGYQKAIFYFTFLIYALFHKKVVIGDANSFLFRLVKNFYSKKKFILLDDGVATLNNVVENSTYQRFTIFPQHVANSIANNYSGLTTLLSSVKSKPTDLIIGGKLVDEGICSFEDYIKALDCMILKLRDGFRPLIYVAHRGESDAIVGYVRQKYGIRVVRTKYPVELIEFELGIKPFRVAHILSSAVFSLKLLYSECQFFTYQLDDSSILDRYEKIKNIYRILSKEFKSEYIQHKKLEV